jgi:hypothetical protein
LELEILREKKVNGIKTREKANWQVEGEKVPAISVILRKGITFKNRGIPEM